MPSLQCPQNVTAKMTTITTAKISWTNIEDADKTIVVEQSEDGVNFEEIIRALNAIHYDGPLSVEWEDSGMDRIFGATEAFEFVKKINFSPSKIAFDGQFDTAVKNQANA